MKKIFLFLLIAGIYSCTPKAAPSPAKTTSAFTDTDVARGKVFWTDCSIEKLDAANTLYTAKCGTCHSLKAPTSRDEEAWKKVVPPMAKKAKLTAEEEALILNYVLTMKDAKK